jgi:methyltransferase-like protein
MVGKPNPYDSVAYPSFSFSATHPDRLAAMGILHGLSPAPVEQSRVLEIGCNDGANIVPMAYAIPGGQFVGFDLAHLPIERGLKQIRELKLQNVRLFQGNLLDVGRELGKFDYIIAHGLYAWVPEPVRDRLMAFCGELLSANGVAYVSYNTLPGGHLRTMIREMMLNAVDGVDDPEERVSGGLDFLRLLIATRQEDDAYRMLIEDQLKKMEKAGTHVTFHDEFAEAYHPVHFVHFVEHARKHGLQYLCEATLPPATDPAYRQEIRSALGRDSEADIIMLEQQLDYLRGRMYRETLLCRGDRALRRDFPAQHFRRLLFASQATLAPVQQSGAISFTSPRGIKMESNCPGITGLVEILAAKWPAALSFDEVAQQLMNAGIAFNADGVTLIMRLIVTKMIEIRTWKAPLATSVSNLPRASACARREARTKMRATTLLHERIAFEDPIVRSFFQLLDGTRDRRAILDALESEFPDRSTGELVAGIDPGLENFFRAALLEA